MTAQNVASEPSADVHVDVVLNDWSGARRILLGLVEVEGGEPRHRLSPAGDGGTLSRLASPAQLGAVDALDYLGLLHEKYGNGSYLEVSDVHPVGACPFGRRWHVDMTITRGVLR